VTDVQIRVRLQPRASRGVEQAALEAALVDA